MLYVNSKTGASFIAPSLFVVEIGLWLNSRQAKKQKQ